MDSKESMKQALLNRKGKGLDLTIIIGSPEKEEKEELSELGLAPPAPEINEEAQSQVVQGEPSDLEGAPDMAQMLMQDGVSFDESQPALSLKDKMKQAIMSKFGNNTKAKGIANV